MPSCTNGKLGYGVATGPVFVERAAHLRAPCVLDNLAWHVVSVILRRRRELNSEACIVPEAVKRHVSVDILLSNWHRHEPTRTYVCCDHPACLPPKVCAFQAAMLGGRLLRA
jgi:hypothetical protein